MKYFGQIADQLQLAEETISIEVNETLNVREFIEKRYPSLAQNTYQIAINEAFEELIEPSMNVYEIALLPPFAGG